MNPATGHRLALCALLACAIPGPAGAAPPSAASVIAAAKRATGGSAWDKPKGCHEQGTRGDGSIAYTTDFSLRRYGMRVESRRGGTIRAMGFNGKARWQSDGTRRDIATDPEALKEAVVTAYLSNNGFFFPRRFPADVRYVRLASDAGRRFDVLDITPVGGRRIEVWFDQATHLIDRVIDTLGTPPVTVRASDYRRIGDVTIAFRLTVFGPDGTVLDNGALTAFRCGPVDTALFDPPPPP